MPDNIQKYNTGNIYNLYFMYTYSISFGGLTAMVTMTFLYSKNEIELKILVFLGEFIPYIHF